MTIFNETNSDDINSGWNYHSGHLYFGGWIGYIVLLVPTFLANVVTYFLVTYSPRINKSSSSLMVRYLSIEDAGFSLCCLIQCVINLDQMTLFGKYYGCEIQAIYALFFMLSTGYTLCLISYNSHQKIQMKPGLTERQVLLSHLVIWSFAFLISILSSYVVSPARLMPSATYCLVSLLNLESGLIFYIPGIGFIGLFLIHRYICIYKYLSDSTQQLKYSQQQMAAQKRQVVAAKKMFVFVLIFFLCGLPVLVISIVEISFNILAAPWLHLLAGHLVHTNSFFNPILYVWMNKNSRLAVLDFYYKHFYATYPRPAESVTTMIQVRSSTKENSVEQVKPTQEENTTIPMEKPVNIAVERIRILRQDNSEDSLLIHPSLAHKSLEHLEKQSSVKVITIL